MFKDWEDIETRSGKHAILYELVAQDTAEKIRVEAARTMLTGDLILVSTEAGKAVNLHSIKRYLDFAGPSFRLFGGFSMKLLDCTSG